MDTVPCGNRRSDSCCVFLCVPSVHVAEFNILECGMRTCGTNYSNAGTLWTDTGAQRRTLSLHLPSIKFSCPSHHPPETHAKCTCSYPPPLQLALIRWDGTQITWAKKTHDKSGVLSCCKSVGCRSQSRMFSPIAALEYISMV